jgi:hypothetical protein
VSVDAEEWETDAPKRRGRPPGTGNKPGPKNQKTPEHQGLIYEGCSISELAAIFGNDRRTVTEKLRTCPQAGTRQGYPIYTVAAAAAYLVEPLVDIEAYIKRLRPQDLPPLLTKEFWAGQIAKQKFQLNDSKLWPTEDVMTVLADVFKRLKSGILLFADTVEAKSELTDLQRKLINELSDGLLIELHRTLVEGDIDADDKLKLQLGEDLLES